jgi:hypothetical protein
VITAETAVAAMNSPEFKIIVVVMDGCGPCGNMKAFLKSAAERRHVDGSRIHYLPREEWSKVQDVFPTEGVPQVFRVGKGRVERGPGGAPSTEDAKSVLAEFVNHVA